MIQQITLQSLKECADQRYAWPGGYEMYAICTDGELLCMECVKDNWEEVSADTAADPQGWGGWAVMGITHDGEMEDDPIYCAHCNKPIGPAAVAEAEMEKFIALYKTESCLPADPPLIFDCYAEDMDHAEEQCVNAYPNCIICWIEETGDPELAFDAYWESANDTTSV